MLRRFLHGRLWLSRRAALARGAEPRVLESRPQERASQQPHPRAVSLRVGWWARWSARRHSRGEDLQDPRRGGHFQRTTLTDLRRGLVMRTAIKKCSRMESAVYLPRSAHESEKTLRKCRVSVVSVLLPSLTLTLITCPTRCSAPEG